MLRIKNVSKTYKMKNHTVEAVKNVDIDLEDKQLVCILGASGSGKTTLMNIIGALDTDFQGDIIIDEKSLKSVKGSEVDAYRRERIGFIFQQFALVNSLKAKENVELALEISGTKKSEKKKITKELLTHFDMEQHGRKKANKLSGGQKQRIAISRALANNPDIILADEPTGALDSKTGRQVMLMLKELSKEKLVVVVTHAEEIADEFADTVVRMEDGKVIAVEEKTKQIEGEKKKEEKQAGTNQKEKKGNMSFFGAYRYALRNLWIKKGRTIATAIGLSFGIIGIALAIALTTGASTSFQSQLSQIIPTNDITVTLPVNEGVKNQQDLKPFAYSDIDKILGISDDLIGFSAQGSSYIFPAKASLSEKDVETQKEETGSITGFNMRTPSEVVEDTVIYGQKPAKNSFDEVLISMSTAKDLLKKGVKIDTIIGQTIYVKQGIATQNGPPTFKTKQFKIVGVTSSNSMGGSIYPTSRGSLNTAAEFENVPVENLKIMAISVFSKETVKDVNTFSKKLNKKQSEFNFVGTSQLAIDQVNSALSKIRLGLIGLSSISILVAILMIAIVVYLSVIEKIREIGIIKAIGGRNKDIRNIFIGESISIGLLSGLIGVGISQGLAGLINKIATNFITQMGGGNTTNLFKIADLTLTASLALIGISVLISVISGLIPAMKASKLDPVESLRK